ncbi:MAG: prolipoprotein diacylglyceryl transferase [Deltaproteobacteria bacterium]|nr:prolipoprotein diacylglyceryl transferase [Deltaproteobacteria bacterium]NND28510.1 prolipoprotein diacylglyceryl transferase [Myxococcales bacterium]MBT8463036.1 prolipoprotein diacylglyceryl transferase [Deltaproteobacteria bacterium]MBT8482978.1 prolipoprotein diacylglyceryl transferase [Deltaproteobacteria bacterium]NNK08620.1 prolipoprotein diacylglyceryl transferase [Myxococcales bacterium]
MHPTLAEIFGEPIPAYFTLLLIGFALATWLAARLARKDGLNPDTFIDLGLFSVILGVLGARLMHVFVDGYFWDYVHLCTDPSKVGWEITAAQCTRAEGLWDNARQLCQPSERDCFAWIAFWRGGLTYYGGLIAAAAFGIWFLKHEGLPLFAGMDIAAIGISLGLVFGRLGCFLGGCCFGVDTSGPLGVSFPPFSPASESQWRAGLLEAPHLPSVPVHPTQLYEAFGCLAITGFLLFWLRPRKGFDGQLMLVFVGLYAILRFFLELLRADERGELLGLSTSQVLAIPALLLVVALWPRWSRG